MLASPLYMMQVYNRVLPGRSEPTLLVLSMLTLGLLIVMALLEITRSRVLVRISGQLELKLGEAVVKAMVKSAVASPRASAQPIRDFDTIRQFLAGTAIFAFFDAPWTPIIIGIVFVFHPVLGIIAAAGAVGLFGIGLLNEFVTKGPLEAAARHSMRFNVWVDSALRNAEVLEAMGMLKNVRRRWYGLRNEILGLQAVASDRAGSVAAWSKFLRLALQTALLGAGAYLALQDLISPGVIIAASILVGRGLAPVESAIGTWKQFISARVAYARLSDLLIRQPPDSPRTSLPRPRGVLQVESLVAAPPGAEVPILRDISFGLPAGQLLGIIGRSGAGKSTLARTIVGAWRPSAGKVRLDGADIQNWDPDELGRHIGYLPQDIELFEGTVGENIARFGDLDSGRIVAAAQRAGLHATILRLPKGYETPVGPGGCVLSGGQRQRIGLARALYGDPVLIVLDEPDSNLDEEGGGALAKAIIEMKLAGSTVILISHRPNIIGLLDHVMILVDGSIRAFGPRQEVLTRLARPSVAPVRLDRPTAAAG